MRSRRGMCIERTEERDAWWERCRKGRAGQTAREIRMRVPARVCVACCMAWFDRALIAALCWPACSARSPRRCCVLISPALMTSPARIR